MTFAEWFSTTPRGHNPTLTEAFAAGAASRDAEVATLRELKQAWHDKFWESEKEHNQLREQVKMLSAWIKQQGEITNTCTFNILREVCENCACHRNKALAATEQKP